MKGLLARLGDLVGFRRRLADIDERTKEHTALLKEILRRVEVDPEAVRRISEAVSEQKQEMLDALDRNTPR